MASQRRQRAVPRPGGDLRGALGVALAWQLVLWRTWGVAPLAQGSDRLGLPFAGIWHVTRGAFQFGALPLVVRLDELVFVVAAALATAWSLPRSTALAHEKLAWAMGLAVVGGVLALGRRRR